MPRPAPGSRLSPWRIFAAMALMFALGAPTLISSSAPAETPAAVQIDRGAQPGDALVAAADPAPAAAPASAARKAPEKKHTASFTTKLLPELGAIAALLLVILLVILRLPKIELGHSKQFLRRRVMNWLPLGLTYSFLYMGRYNLNKATEAFEWGTGHAPLMDTTDFAVIFMVGTITYGVSFLLNGPVTDRIGGKKAILLGAGGAALANIAMGIVTILALDAPPGDVPLTPIFIVLYAINMYFQSFGAVAIVKVNSSWFHVRERGVFGAIFGILISLGVYFAYDWGKLIVENVPLEWVFFLPAIILVVFFALDVFLVQDTPSKAGLEDFDTADASSGDDGPRLPVKAVFAKMFTSKIIMTIAVIEFCSGFLRQAVMQFYPKYIAATVPTEKPFIFEHWGMFLCTAGILGGLFAGVISDHVFDSRRGPVAALLYGIMVAGAILALALFTTPAIGIIALGMSLAVIGVHGMLSGTASMDFGGRKNVGVAVGIIDGFVYLGTGLMSLIYSVTLPEGPAEKVVADNWISWPIAMIPMAIIGFFLATRIWNAKPKAANAGH